MLTKLSLCLSLLPAFLLGDHLLMYVPWNTRSHRMQQDAVLEGMLARGHKVTGVFPQKYHSHHENYTEIVVNDKSDDLKMISFLQ